MLEYADLCRNPVQSLRWLPQGRFSFDAPGFNRVFVSAGGRAHRRYIETSGERHWQELLHLCMRGLLSYESNHSRCRGSTPSL
jgi:hypothetical protein